jgi:hypothetical protein
MKINFVKQIEFEKIKPIEFDFLICSSGFESRAAYSTKMLFENNVSIHTKICFSFTERKSYSKVENDKYFSNNDFITIDITSNDISYYSEIFCKLLEGNENKKISIYFDYSCMTSIIYGGLLKFLNDSMCDKEIDIYFSYTHAKFTKAIKSNPLFFNHPIPLFDPIQTTNKRVALLVGLGYEEDKALGLYEYFQNDSEDIYLFVTKNEGFYNEVIKSNSHIIELVNKHNIIFYELENIHPLISTLDSLINYLVAQNYRVVVAPIGPKIFNLISLIVNLYHNEITTYRLSDGNKGTPIDKVADNSKMPTILQLNMINQKSFVID